MFLRLIRNVGDDWRVHESDVRELLSVLCDSRENVGKVALDPMPEMLAETVELAGLSQERFLERILRER